jgi:hypothetical protein
LDDEVAGWVWLVVEGLKMVVAGEKMVVKP